MRSVLLIACLIVAPALACGGRGGADTTPGRASDPGDPVLAAARGTVEQWRQGWEVRSLDALTAVYRNDLDVVVVHQGRAHLGWSAVEAYLVGQLGPATEVRVKLDDLQVFPLGPGAAAVTAAITREHGQGGVTTTERGVITMTLSEGADGRWRIVTEHYSYPPSAP